MVSLELYELLFFTPSFLDENRECDLKQKEKGVKDLLCQARLEALLCANNCGVGG